MNAFHAEVHPREIGLLQPRPQGAFPGFKGGGGGGGGGGGLLIGE